MSKTLSFRSAMQLRPSHTIAAAGIVFGLCIGGTSTFAANLAGSHAKHVAIWAHPTSARRLLGSGAPVILRVQAVPNPVTTSSTTITVNATDPGGTTLSYAWTQTAGPATAPIAAPTSSSTGLSFTKAGTYTFQIVVTDALSLSTSQSYDVIVNATPTVVTLTPRPTGVALGSTKQFSATAVDQFGNLISPNPATTWTVARGSVGSISSGGLYSAGATKGTATVKANMGAASDSVTFAVNLPPTVNSVTATPNPVTGTTTSLSASVTDAAGSAGDTYLWTETSGPVAIIGSPTSASPTVTFSHAGSYVFGVQVTDSFGVPATGSVSVTVNTTPTTLIASPSPAFVAPNGIQPFTAVVFDQFGGLIASPTVTWTSIGDGSINPSTGVFTAGPTSGTATVTGTDGAASGNATVTVANLWVATAAAAAPSTVTGTSTSLSVLGGSSFPESRLSYHWTAVGPMPVTFSDNSDNAAKNCTATFSKAGSYTLTCTITDPFGTRVTSSVVVVVNQTASVVTVTPNPVSLQINETQQFAATVADQFGHPMTTAGVVWSASLGTITPAGLYTAGGTTGTDDVTATDGSASGFAVATIVDSAPTINSATASPNPVIKTTSTLAVVATDVNSQASLTYAWTQTSGPASIIATPSSATSKVTFPAAGTYTYSIKVTNVSGMHSSQTVTVVVNQTPKSASVTPPSATVPAGGTQQFDVVVTDQFGNPISGQTVAWSTRGFGSISSTGLYTASTLKNPDTVVGLVDGITCTASVTVN